MTDLREKIFVSLLPYISARATEATNAVLAVLREQEPAGEWTEKGNRAELRDLKPGWLPEGDE